MSHKPTHQPTSQFSTKSMVSKSRVDKRPEMGHHEQITAREEDSRVSILISNIVVELIWQSLTEVIKKF